jgi:hypothetical protein
LLLPELAIGCEPDVSLYATWHRYPADGGIAVAKPQWLRFALETPEEITSFLPRDVPLAVLHFACTLSNAMRRVLQTDCFGTERFVRELKRAISAPIWFVFASSIDAERNDLSYGLGKAYVENSLVGAAEGRFVVTNVRIPAVQGLGSVRWHVAATAFALAFLRQIDFHRSMDRLRRGELVQKMTELVYLTSDTA